MARSVPTGTCAVHPSRRPVGGNVDACASASMPGSSSTNAPKSVTRVTRPFSTWPTSYLVSTVDHGSAINCFRPSEIFCVALVDAQHLDGDLLAGL